MHREFYEYGAQTQTHSDKVAEVGRNGRFWGIMAVFGLFWDSRGVFVHERAAIAFAHHSGWKARPTQALYRTAQCPSHGRQYEISNRDTESQEG